MIRIQCARPSLSAQLLHNKIIELGGEALEGTLVWGRGGGSKYAELETLAGAGVPVPPHSRTKHPGWLARTERHREARDLLLGLQKGDYYVEYIPTIREHRLHVMEGKIVRVQGKVPRLPDPHPRYRSWRAGWKLVASPSCTEGLPPDARVLAKRAVAALGYEFGAVDIGTTEIGEAVVFEVNSQPGLEGRTVECYARAILHRFGM